MLETITHSQTDQTRDEIAAIGRAFRDARLAQTALQGFPGPMPKTLAQAYEVQDQSIADWPDVVIGWKVGRILGELETLHGTNRLVGPIFSRNLVIAEAGTSTSFTAITDGFCAVEAEYVFRLGKSAPAGRLEFDAHAALDLVGDCHIGIEIAGSPLATINALGPTVVVSDFGNNAGLIVGPALTHWRDRLDALTARLSIDGQEIGSGSVSSFSGGIVASLVFALERAAQRGVALQAGCYISTGAVTGVHEIRHGQSCVADFGPDGQIACHCLAPLSKVEGQA